MPGDPTFSQANNKYDVASYKRICAEFGINPSSDFRFTNGANYGLGSVYIYVSYSGPEKKTEYDYPGSNKFLHEGGSASKSNLVYYIYQDSEAEAQADLYCKNTAGGLTQAGWSPGGGLPKKLGRGVRPASQNPYRIYDQNLRFFLPYL